MNTESSQPTGPLSANLRVGLHAESDPRAVMSALCDGDSAAAGPACAAWAQDAQARRAWHEYHLIGDVLRSDELALRPQRDAAFLAALRTRLAQEPVPLAPQPVAAVQVASSSLLAAPRSMARLGWRAPVAVAAGFAAVAVVIGLVRPGAGFGGAAQEALAGAGTLSVSADSILVSTQAGAGGLAGVGFVVAPESLMIRNPQLDAHLRAHQAARLRAAAEPSVSSLRDSPSLMPPDLVAAHLLKRASNGRVGLGAREAGQ
jgi:sigma-E factor negative regulatory protein RseA